MTERRRSDVLQPLDSAWRGALAWTVLPVARRETAHAATRSVTPCAVDGTHWLWWTTRIGGGGHVQLLAQEKLHDGQSAWLHAHRADVRRRDQRYPGLDRRSALCNHAGAGPHCEGPGCHMWPGRGGFRVDGPHGHAAERARLAHGHRHKPAEHHGRSVHGRDPDAAQ